MESKKEEVKAKVVAVLSNNDGTAIERTWKFRLTKDTTAGDLLAKIIKKEGDMAAKSVSVWTQQGNEIAIGEKIADHIEDGGQSPGTHVFLTAGDPKEDRFPLTQEICNLLSQAVPPSQAARRASVSPSKRQKADLDEQAEDEATDLDADMGDAEEAADKAEDKPADKGGKGKKREAERTSPPKEENRWKKKDKKKKEQKKGKRKEGGDDDSDETGATPRLPRKGRHRDDIPDSDDDGDNERLWEKIRRLDQRMDGHSAAIQLTTDAVATLERAAFQNTVIVFGLGPLGSEAAREPWVRYLLQWADAARPSSVREICAAGGATRVVLTSLEAARGCLKRLKAALRSQSEFIDDSVGMLKISCTHALGKMEQRAAVVLGWAMTYMHDSFGESDGLRLLPRYEQGSLISAATWETMARIKTQGTSWQLAVPDWAMKVFDDRFPSEDDDGLAIHVQTLPESNGKNKGKGKDKGKEKGQEDKGKGKGKGKKQGKRAEKPNYTAGEPPTTPNPQEGDTGGDYQSGKGDNIFGQGGKGGSRGGGKGDNNFGFGGSNFGQRGKGGSGDGGDNNFVFGGSNFEQGGIGGGNGGKGDNIFGHGGDNYFGQGGIGGGNGGKGGNNIFGFGGSNFGQGGIGGGNGGKGGGGGKGDNSYSYGKGGGESAFVGFPAGYAGSKGPVFSPPPPAQWGQTFGGGFPPQAQQCWHNPGGLQSNLFSAPSPPWGGANWGS